jgi:hypothetical protein
MLSLEVTISDRESFTPFDITPEFRAVYAAN